MKGYQRKKEKSGVRVSRRAKWEKRGKKWASATGKMVGV